VIGSWWRLAGWRLLVAGFAEAGMAGIRPRSLGMLWVEQASKDPIV